MSFEGLPDDVIVDTTIFHTMDGDLDFKAAICLKKIGNDHQAHDYNIKLVCTGSVTGKRSYDLKLKVLERKLGAVNGTALSAQSVLGKWGNCWESMNGTKYKDVLTMVHGTDSLVVLSNILNWKCNPGVQIYFNPDGTMSLKLGPSGWTPTQVVYAADNVSYFPQQCTGAYNANYMAMTMAYMVRDPAAGNGMGGFWIYKTATFIMQR